MKSYVATTSFVTQTESYTKGNIYRFAGKADLYDYEKCGFLQEVEEPVPVKQPAKVETATK